MKLGDILDKSGVFNIIFRIVLIITFVCIIWVVGAKTIEKMDQGNIKNQENIAINATKKYTNYSTDHSKLPQAKAEDYSVSCIVKIKTLINNNYLTDKDITNKITNKKLDGCVKVTFIEIAYSDSVKNDSQRYRYKYLPENKCNIQECN